MTMAEVTDHSDELVKRSLIHDASKFDPEERIPYIWLTEFYRCKRDCEPFIYPDGMEQRVRDAIAHHMSRNRHHPEFHADPNDMTEVDLIEMVCDWTAMAQEFKQCGGMLADGPTRRSVIVYPSTPKRGGSSMKRLDCWIVGWANFNSDQHRFVATNEAFQNGWFKTGDIAVIQDAYNRIMGRQSDDILKSGG